MYHFVSSLQFKLNTKLHKVKQMSPHQTHHALVSLGCPKVANYPPKCCV